MTATKDKPGTALATTIEPGALTVANVLNLTRGGGYVRLPEEDGAEVAARMLGQKLEADTAEGLFGDDQDREVLKPKEIIGLPFTLREVSFRNADITAYPDSIGIFAVLQITLQGDDQVLITGSTDVVMKAMRAAELGVLPRVLMIRSDKTKSGNDVLNLVDAVQPSADGPGF